MIYKIRYPKWFLGDEGDISKIVIRWGLMLLIVFSPLPSGSADYWAVLIMRAVVLIMFGAYLMIREKQDINPQLAAFIKKLRLPVGALLIYIILQSLPLPDFLIKVLSPMTLQFKRAYSIEPVRRSFSTLSLVPLQTFRAFLELLTYVLAGFLVLKTVTTREHLKKLIRLFLAVGIFQSVYGMIQLARTTPRISIHSRVLDVNVVTGTFSQPNQLAGYLFMVFPLCMGMIAAGINPRILAKKSWQERFVYMANHGGGSIVLLVTAMFVMCSAILLIRVRAGPFLVGFAVALFLCFFLLYFVSLGKNPYFVKYVGISVAVVLAAVLFFGINASKNRFVPGEPSRGGIIRTWIGNTRIIEDFPLFGTGLGTFFTVNPVYAMELNSYSRQPGASDFLEYLSELGIVGTALLMYLVISSGIRLLGVWRIRKDPELKGLGMGGIVSLFLAGVYGFVNAGIHVPGNMLCFSILFSLALAAVHLNWEGSRISVKNDKIRLGEKRKRFRHSREQHEKNSFLK